jgi:hypothetical protein
MQGFAIGTAALILLIGSPVASSAQPKVPLKGAARCDCSCFYETRAEGVAVGVFTFFTKPDNTKCSFNAIDLYVPCKGRTGAIHPSVGVFDCKFTPAIAPAPVAPPLRR